MSYEWELDYGDPGYRFFELKDHIGQVLLFKPERVDRINTKFGDDQVVTVADVATLKPDGEAQTVATATLLFGSLGKQLAPHCGSGRWYAGLYEWVGNAKRLSPVPESYRDVVDVAVRELTAQDQAKQQVKDSFKLEEAPF